jgi:hypothetical protein
MADVPSYQDEQNNERLAMPTSLLAPDGTFREPGKPSKDQDPIYDHENGVIAPITANAASVTVFTPPVGCKFVEVFSDVDILLRTDNIAITGASDPKALPVQAATTKIIPVVEAVPVKGWSLLLASVRFMPMKVRS